MSISPEEALRVTRNLISPEGTVTQKEIETIAFFETLLEKRPIDSIYYPGNGFDFSLDKVFKPHQVTYLDREPRRDSIAKGDFRSTPEFLDGTFDAVFIQDLHQNRMGFSEIIRTVKENGLVIVGLYECGLEPQDAMSFDEVSQYPLLKEAIIVENHPKFKTFIKLENIRK